MAGIGQLRAGDHSLRSRTALFLCLYIIIRAMHGGYGISPV